MRYIRTKDEKIIDAQKGTMDRLDERERHCLETLYDNPDKKREEVSYMLAKEYGCTCTRIKQILTHATLKIEKGRDWLEKNVLEESDNIEELCDEFVYSDNSFKNVLYKSLEPVKTLIKLRNNCNVYGAIWTEKGLIYVAKLNEKGEWELI